MAWPTTGAGTLATGYLATGRTTIVWGTTDILANIGGVVTSGAFGVVTRFSERPQVDTIKLQQGDGLTSTRVMIIDGLQWDLTVRDDVNITIRPRLGNTVLVYDAGGLVGGTWGGSGAAPTPVSYIATIVEVNYDSSPKQAAEFHIVVENLTLFTEAQVAL